MDVRVVILPSGEGLPLPGYETPGSAGADLRAAIPEGEKLTLLPGKRALIPTGLSLEIPRGYEVQIRARSGLAAKHGIGLVNGIGTIDSDYRGELGVILINHGDEPFVVRRGDRIAQCVVAAVIQAQFVPADTLTSTDRRGGFGSTGQ